MSENSLADAADASGTPAPDAVPPVDGANSTDTAALATPAVETPAATGDSAVPPTANVPAPRNRAEERIAELVAERNFYREKALAGLTPAAPKPAEPAPPKGPPTLAEYEYDTDQWAQAHAKWTSEEIARGVSAGVQRELGATRQATEAETLKANWETGCATFEKAHPDFRDVVFAQDLPITPVMVEVLSRSEIGPALAYKLGQNKAEATRISRLPQTLQAVALGRLEASLLQAPTPAAQAAKTVTRAPAPLTPIGAATPASKKLDDMPIDEYLANRPWAHNR